MLRPLISFNVSWTQRVIECNAEMKQLHSMRLTQGSIAHHYFWEGGQARFLALSSSPNSTYSRWGSYQVLVVVSQWVWHRPAVIAILEPYKNHDWSGSLAGTGLYHWDKAFLQRAPSHFTKCTYTEGLTVDLLYNGAFQPLHGRSSPISEQTHDHCGCRSVN